MTKIGTITTELIQQIIEANPLIEVAKDYGVDAVEGGKARCPFHKDGKNGNLHFYSDNTYFCFHSSCSAGRKWEDKEKTKKHVLKLPNGVSVDDGGPNVIGFVMNIEQVNYPEAVKILCERGGVPMPKAYVDPAHQKYKRKLTKMNQEYYENLKNNDDLIAYLEGRGITKKSMGRFRLGYIPEGQGHYPFKERIEGRLVFGITEESYSRKKAATIAMAYRAMTDEQAAQGKYLNDYNTKDALEGVYHKSNVLYGWNDAVKSIRRNGYAIVTEGYFDVILAHQCGLENTVATCGTAFSINQMEKLRRITDKLVFWYDGDNAGYDAMMKNLPQLLELGFRVQIVDSPGYDPADLMNKLGQDTDRIKRFVKEHAKSALQMITEEVLNDYESKLAELKTDALDELLPYLDNITSETDRIVFKSMIDSRLNITI